MALIVANIITDVTDWLDEFSSNWWFLLVIFAVALLDSVIPVVPSETTVIIGGVAAGQGNQSIAMVIFAGAFGAFLGIVVGLLFGLAAAAAMPESVITTITVPFGTLVSVAVIAMICGVLAGLLPARRAARLDGLDAISHE